MWAAIVGGIIIGLWVLGVIVMVTAELTGWWKYDFMGRPKVHWWQR